MKLSDIKKHVIHLDYRTYIDLIEVVAIDPCYDCIDSDTHIRVHLMNGSIIVLLEKDKVDRFLRVYYSFVEENILM